jgi:hypothetical protein
MTMSKLIKVKREFVKSKFEDTSVDLGNRIKDLVIMQIKILGSSRVLKYIGDARKGTGKRFFQLNLSTTSHMINHNHRLYGTQKQQVIIGDGTSMNIIESGKLKAIF